MIDPVPPSPEDRSPRSPPIVLDRVIAKSILHTGLSHPRPIIRPDGHPIIPVIADTAILDDRMRSALTEINAIRIIVANPAIRNHQPLRHRHRTRRVITGYPETAFKMLHP